MITGHVGTVGFDSSSSQRGPFYNYLSGQEGETSRFRTISISASQGPKPSRAERALAQEAAAITCRSFR